MGWLVSFASARCHRERYPNLHAFGLGSFIYLDSEAPQYPTGYYTSGAIALVAIISCIVLKVGYARVNRQRNQLTREEIESNWTEEKL